MNKYQYKVQGVDYDVEIEEVEGNVAKVNVNGIRFDVELKQPINATSSLKKVHIEAPKPVARPVTGNRLNQYRNALFHDLTFSNSISIRISLVFSLSRFNKHSVFPEKTSTNIILSGSLPSGIP